MNPRKLLLLVRSMRHTRPRQLFARFRLKIKRTSLSGLQRLGWAPRLVPATISLGQASEDGGGATRLNTSLPASIFPPRRHLAGAGAKFPMARFLNLEHPLDVPVGWHPVEWEKGTRLEKLNLHYMEYLEALENSDFERIVADWIAQNRSYRLGYWLDCWNSYALSIRAAVWMQQFAAREAKLSSGFRTRMLASLWDQIRFLERNLEKDIGGNHLIKNIKALLWAGAFFDAPEAARWRRLGQRMLREEIAEQILEDGEHYERSPAYHCQVFADLLECRSVLGADEPLDWLDAALARMAQALADLTHPDGLVSLFNDGGLHMAWSPEECLRVFRALTGREVSAQSQIHYPAAGYYGLRRGGDYFLFDCGKIAPDFLPAHGHGDILAFEWDLAERRLVVDAGVCEYHEGKWREYSRSTAAHNTVTLDDADQCEFWKSFRVGRRAATQLRQCEREGKTLRVTGSHDGFARLAGKPIHERSVWTDLSRIEIHDRILGGAGQAARARILLHPDCRPERSAEGVGFSSGPVRALLRTAHPVRLEEAWWMPDFGVRIATARIVIEYGNAPCEGGFILEGRHDEGPSPNARKDGESRPAES